jgi:hypothetical protein
MGGPMGHKPVDINTGLDKETEDAYKKVSTILGMLSQTGIKPPEQTSELTRNSEYKPNPTELTRFMNNTRVV